MLKILTKEANCSTTTDTLNITQWFFRNLSHEEYLQGCLVKYINSSMQPFALNQSSFDSRIIEKNQQFLAALNFQSSINFFNWHFTSKGILKWTGNELLGSRQMNLSFEDAPSTSPWTFFLSFLVKFASSPSSILRNRNFSIIFTTWQFTSSCRLKSRIKRLKVRKT